MSETIKVVVRVRPMNTKEKQRGCLSIINADEAANYLGLTKPDEQDNIKHFTFDHVFGEQSQQDIVYSKTAYNLVQNVILGYNGTIFAYGQTGCGKTHSMVGKVEVEELQGIIPRSFGHILKTISETKDKQFLIRCSFIEIYNEEVRDLLGKEVKAKLQIKESPEKGVFIKDLSMNTAKTHQQLMDFMVLGNKNRSVGETAMNKDSSRSHLLFMLYLQSSQATSGQQQRKYVASKLNLVDLAGSERLSKTGAEGDRLKQAQKINLSLSALGNVISALVDGKSQHIPYRDSKLTRLLQDSLGGNTKTVMVANCSPADYNFDETLSTLRYAARAKFIKNKPIINQDPKDALLKEYAQEIKKLKRILQGQNYDPQALKKELIPKIEENSEQINEKLKEKEMQLNKEKVQKQMLLQKIKELQTKHLQGKDVRIDQKLKRNVEKARVSLEQYIQPPPNKNLQEEEKTIEMQKTNSEKQKIDKYKTILKKYKAKIKTLELELKDINHENYLEKEILLQDVRSVAKENKFLQSIISIMLLPTQLETIRNTAQYNQQKQDYKIPPFYLKNKQVVFPKLQENQSIQMIRQMQQGRKLQWDKQDPLKGNFNVLNTSTQNLNNRMDTKKSENCIRQVIREARSQQNNITPKDEKKNVRKLQLDPIKKNTQV